MKSTALPVLGCLLLALSITAPAARAISGDLDTLNANLVGRGVKAIAVQPDGKTIIAGDFTSVLGQPRNKIARLNTDGTLDADFAPNVTGAAGMVSLDPNINFAVVESVVVQADGKIVIGGNFTSVDGTAHNLIARLTGDGFLDVGFNRNFTFPSGVLSASVLSMAVQSDGKILIAGGLMVAGNPFAERSIIERLEADGTRDPSFNPIVGTSVTTSPGGTTTVLYITGVIDCVAVQGDGKVLFAGDFASVGGINRRTIVRVAADGSLDPSFVLNMGGNVRSIVVQPNGQLLLGGSFIRMDGSAHDSLLRVETDGMLAADFNPNVVGDIYSLAVQADGKILLGGSFTSVGGIACNNIARVTADGTLDAGFNPNANSIVHGVAVQANGQLLLGGKFTTVGGAVRNYFARLVNDPATETLSGVDATRVLWIRGGSAPEVSQTAFELSTNGGASWTPLGGTATRVGSTANWQLTGLSLPTSGLLRARGRALGGNFTGSCGLVEQVAEFNFALQTWRQTFFGTTANMGNAADTCDFDQDGLVNLIEYAFGLSPLHGGSGQIPQPGFSGGNYELSFTQPAGVGGITYGADWSETLLPGSWTDIPDSGAAPQHVFSVPAGGSGQKFVRLKVTTKP